MDDRIELPLLTLRHRAELKTLHLKKEKLMAVMMLVPDFILLAVSVVYRRKKNPRSRRGWGGWDGWDQGAWKNMKEQ